jgi:hypothetical protein
VKVNQQELQGYFVHLINVPWLEIRGIAIALPKKWKLFAILRMRTATLIAIIPQNPSPGFHHTELVQWPGDLVTGIPCSSVPIISVPALP